MESTERKIRDIVIRQYEIHFAKNSLSDFQTVHNSLSLEYPDGQLKYYKSVLFELKKNAISEQNDYYLRNWVARNCFQVSTKEGFEHFIKYLKNRFVDWLDWKCIDFKYYVKKDINDVLVEVFEYLEKVVSNFYIDVSKITYVLNTLYDLENPEIDSNGEGLTLWDLFNNKEDAEKIKNILRKNNNLIDNENEKPSFTPNRKSTLYEPSSLYHSLESNELFKPNLNYSQPTIKNILSNTFKDFNCDLQAIGKGKGHQITRYYRSICKLK